MLIKGITFFLIFMLVLAMFGRLRWPGRKPKDKPRKCPECGSFIIGKGDCACKSRG